MSTEVKRLPSGWIWGRCTDCGWWIQEPKASTLGSVIKRAASHQNERPHKEALSRQLRARVTA